jgi:hypothetical protein
MRKKLTRKDLEQARNMAALKAMFFWQLADRKGTSSSKWRTRGDTCAEAALRLDRELNGADDDDAETT